jgi:membrane-associated phospholipid phosphatase
MDALQEYGIQLIQSIQILSPGLDGIMEFFTFLGKVEFYMIFITFLYWIVDANLGFKAFMVLLSTDIVSVSLKKFLHQPRPYWIGDVKGMGVETSYGIPSSHASDSLSVWGYLAIKFKKPWFWATAISLVILISFSRLYLGVHFPHDIVAGWLIGLVILFLFIRYEKKIAYHFSAKSTNYNIGLGFLISLGFIVIGLIVNVLVTNAPDSIIWAQYSTEARTLTDYFTLAGAFVGAFVGRVLMKVSANFQTRGTLVQKVLRYILGIIGVIVALYGLDMVFSIISTDESVLGYILRYIRYGLTTLWVMYGAPWVFLKLKIASYSP